MSKLVQVEVIADSPEALEYGKSSIKKKLICDVSINVSTENSYPARIGVRQSVMSVYI